MLSLQHTDIFQPNFRILLIILTITILCLISAESINKDKSSYRKIIYLLLFEVLFAEIIGHMIFIYEPEPKWIQALVHKLGVQLIFMIINCSFCYAMSDSLKRQKNVDFSTASKVIWYGSIIIVISCVILWDKRFGRPTFAANALISFYTLYLIKQMKYELNKPLPIMSNALNKMEYILFILNLFTYFMSFYNGYEDFDGWYIFNQLRLTVYVLYLIKIYVIIIGWRSISNKRNVDTNNTHNAVSTEMVI